MAFSGDDVKSYFVSSPGRGAAFDDINKSVTVLCLLMALAWQTSSSSAEAHMAAGLKAKEAGRLNEAVAEFRQASMLAPNDAAAFLNLGSASLQAHDTQAARAALKRVLELEPNSLPAHQMLGYALLLEGYAADAIPHLEKAGAQDGLGIAQLQMGKLDEAVVNLKAALVRNPNDPDLLYYLGRATGLLSKQTFDTLLASFPESGRAHQALAENLAVLRRVPEAEKEYREALRLLPQAPGIHLALGEVYARAAQWPKAEGEFRQESSLQPGNAETAFRLGDALLQQGKVKEARKELERADKLQPDMPETLYPLGKADSLDGDPDAAELAWTRLLKIETETSLAAQAHFGLASLYRKQGKTAEADREIQEFKRLQNVGKAAAEK